MQTARRSVEVFAKRQLDTCTLQQDEAWREWKGLVQAVRQCLESKGPELHLRQLLNECMALYRDSFTVPPTVDTLLTAMSGRNSSLLETAFMWLGGWRPTSAITLTYSKTDVSVGGSVDLASSRACTCLLSSLQLSAMEELRRKTCLAESEISNSLASVQMLLADQSMTEAFGLGNPQNAREEPVVDRPPLNTGFGPGKVNRVMEKKLAALRTLYMQANALRLRTLQDLQNLLTPAQAAECVLAAFELVYVMRNLGNAPACQPRRKWLDVTKPMFTSEKSP